MVTGATRGKMGSHRVYKECGGGQRESSGRPAIEGTRKGREPAREEVEK